MTKIFLDGQKVNDLLLNRYWTFKTLSDVSGVGYPTVCNAGSGKASCRVGTLQKICEAFECKPADIIKAGVL